MITIASRHSLTAVLLGLAACTAGARPEADVQSRTVHLDSVADSAVLTLLADRSFRDPVDLDGPTLVIFAPRRRLGETTLADEGRLAQLLADSVAPLATELGVTVLIRTPSFLTFRASGRLIPPPPSHSAATGFILAAPDTPLEITPGLPSPGLLRLAVRRWHAEWQAAHRRAPSARAT